MFFKDTKEKVTIKELKEHYQENKTYYVENGLKSFEKYKKWACI